MSGGDYSTDALANQCQLPELWLNEAAAPAAARTPSPERRPGLVESLQGSSQCRHSKHAVDQSWGLQGSN